MPNEHPPHISPSDLPPKSPEPSRRKRTPRENTKPAKAVKPTKRQKPQRISQQSQQPQSVQQPQQNSPRKGRKIVLIVLLIAILAGGAFLLWDYLFRYDDAKDIQGQWKIEGTTSSIVITDDEIRLTDAVSFNYDLNTFDKTITYGYASYTGSGTYVFTSDRQVLVLTDLTQNLGDGDEGESMRLLKVSDQAVGEPEDAVNNTTQDADTYGADVVGGDMTAKQAYDEDQNPSNFDPDEGQS